MALLVVLEASARPAQEKRQELVARIVFLRIIQKSIKKIKRTKQYIFIVIIVYLQLEGNTSHQHPQNVLGSILSGSGGGNQVSQGHSTTGGEQPGPIRIRNLEDLIRQLEHSSRHLSSSPGSDEMGGGDHDRHFRYRNIAYYVCLIFFIVSCIYTFLSIPPLFIIFQLIFAVLSMQYL